MKTYQWLSGLGCMGAGLIAHTTLEAIGYSMIVTAIIYTIGSQSK